MSFMRLPRCPYCGKQLSYRKTWNIRKYGDYECDRCHQEYGIKYSKGIYLMVLGLFALEIFLFITFGGVFGKITAFTLILMIAPVVILYFMLPLMMSLRRKKGNGPPVPANAGRKPPRTKIYEPGGRLQRTPAGQPPLRQRPPERRPMPQRSRTAAPGLRPQAGQPPMGANPHEQERREREPMREPRRTADGIRREQRPSAPRGAERRRPVPGDRRMRTPENRAGQPPREQRYGRSAGSEPLQRALASAQVFFQKSGAAIKSGAIVAMEAAKTGAFVAAAATKTGAIWLGEKIKTGALWVSAAAQKLFTGLTGGGGNAPRGNAPRGTRAPSGRERGDRQPPARRTGARPTNNRPANSSFERRPGQRPTQGRQTAVRREDPARRRPEEQRGDRERVRREPAGRPGRADDFGSRRDSAGRGNAGNRPSNSPRDRD